MQSLMSLACFVEKLSKKTFGGSSPPPLVKKGLKNMGTYYSLKINGTLMFENPIFYYGKVIPGKVMSKNSLCC